MHSYMCYVVATAKNVDNLNTSGIKMKLINKIYIFSYIAILNISATVSNRNFLCMVAAEDVGDSVCDILIVSVDIVVVIIVVVVSVVDVSFVSAGVTSVGLGNSSVNNSYIIH